MAIKELSYGIDWEGSISSNESEDDGGVTVPETECPLSSSYDIEELRSTIQPLSRSNDYGIDIYECTLAFLYQKLHFALRGTYIQSMQWYKQYKQ